MKPPSEWHYVAAAYLVVFVAVLLWVAIIAAKLSRLQRELGDLVEQARARDNLEVAPE
jgi:CcmD family protein